MWCKKSRINKVFYYHRLGVVQGPELLIHAFAVVSGGEIKAKKNLVPTITDRK